jgi:hypothetical protein
MLNKQMDNVIDLVESKPLEGYEHSIASFNEECEKEVKTWDTGGRSTSPGRTQMREITGSW